MKFVGKLIIKETCALHQEGELILFNKKHGPSTEIVNGNIPSTFRSRANHLSYQTRDVVRMINIAFTRSEHLKTVVFVRDVDVIDSTNMAAV